MNPPGENPILDGEFSHRLPEIPSGSLWLDIALAEGGISSGQFVEISGAESSGKTTLCQHIIAQAQQMDRLCLWIDTDCTFNPGYARQCGVALERLYIARPEYAEQALDILEIIGKSIAGSVVVLDSIDSLIPRAELDLPLGLQSLRGADADDASEKQLSVTLRRLSSAIQKNQATIIFTIRAQTHSSEAYHQLSTHLARLALRLQAGLRLRLHEIGLIQPDKRVIGQRVQARILKCKNIAPPQPVEFDIIYNQGINHSGEVFDLGLQLGLIHQQWEDFTFQGLRLGTGRMQAIETLERRALTQPIEQVIRQKLLRSSFLAET